MKVVQIKYCKIFFVLSLCLLIFNTYQLIENIRERQRKNFVKNAHKSDLPKSLPPIHLLNRAHRTNDATPIFNTDKETEETKIRKRSENYGQIPTRKMKKIRKAKFVKYREIQQLSPNFQNAKINRTQPLSIYPEPGDSEAEIESLAGFRDSEKRFSARFLNVTILS